MGGVALGAVVMGMMTPRAPSNDILNQLIKDKPEFYKFVDIDLATARDDQVFDEPGTFIWVDNQFARGEVTLTLNELKFGKFDLRRQKYVEGPFYRFFITNGVGQGRIRLFISRGYKAASEPIESINRAELAARLGSIVTFDRSGDVIWLEDFEDGIHRAEIDLSGLGATVEWSAERSLRGVYALKMTAGSDASRYAEVKGYLPFPALSRIGYEAATTTDANTEQIEAYIHLYTGTMMLEWGFKFVAATTAVSLITLGGVWVPIFSGALPYFETRLFNLSKLGIDPSAGTYYKMVTGPITMPIAAVPCNVTVPDLTQMHLELFYKITSKPATNAVVYIDSMIMTQNEP